MVEDELAGGFASRPTIRRADVDAAMSDLFLYRTDDGRLLTFEEAWDELMPDLAAGLEGAPVAEQVIDGGDVEAYIFETGVFQTVEVESRILTHYTDGESHWTKGELQERVSPFRSEPVDASLDRWLAEQLEAGILKAVDVLQFLGYQDEDADEKSVIHERLIID